ncbi:hypothetical protein AX15_002544 [Amanita polypyramis BW_CC]|nr:hypothetical protein AX15_002544 [Amanita polypyramis BW_CC]
MSFSLTCSWAYFKSNKDVTIPAPPCLTDGLLYTLAVTIVLSVFLALIFRRKGFNLTLLGTSPNDSPPKKPKERAFGEWTPVPFTYPAITPRMTELVDIKPVPYRPFRPGRYHITMGIRNMNWDDWIELDDQYENYQRIRSHRIRTRGKKAVQVLGNNPELVCGGGEAAIELVHELAEYLSRRYPLSFRITRHKLDVRTPRQHGWDGTPPIHTISVIPLNATHQLPLITEDGRDAAERAMTISALLVQDDLAIMIEGKDGKYYFQAGAICIPGSWRMEDKLGKPLDEIHISGNVPQYKEKLQTSLERFFRRLPVDKPVVRNNYLVQLVRSAGEVTETADDKIDPEELAWSKSTLGPEDEYYGRQQSFLGPPDGPVPTPERLRLRTERQTLRRLPRSGAVIFTIRTYMVAVTELAKEEGVGERLADAVEGWPEEVREYKGRERHGWGPVLREYLRG